MPPRSFASGLGSTVGLRYGREIRLRLDAQVERAEAVERDGVREIRELVREAEVGRQAHACGSYLTTTKRSPVILIATGFDHDIFCAPAGSTGLTPRTR